MIRSDEPLEAIMINECWFSHPRALPLRSFGAVKWHQGLNTGYFRAYEMFCCQDHVNMQPKLDVLKSISPLSNNVSIGSGTLQKHTAVGVRASLRAGGDS
ncbi:hypothetical protein HAX54_012569, partial [Datura stramonium]|nr:hypothetical protein [Datura stramonium]